MPRLQEVELAVAPGLWHELLEGMAAQRRRGEETLGFLLADSATRRGRRAVLRAGELRVPGRSDFQTLSRAGLELGQDWHVEQLLPALLEGRTLVMVHSHPGDGPPEFSAVDDAHEARYARFLAALPGRRGRLFLSVVLSEDFRHAAQRCWKAGAVLPGPRTSLRLAPEEDPRLDRQRVFGEGFRTRLDRLRVCLVGCGGLGAVVAEQLSRLGVRRWVLVDPDVVEETNLNRLPGSSRADARAALPKTALAERLVRGFWEEDAEVLRLEAPLEEVADTLPELDWMILATDNHASRLRALELWRRGSFRLLNLASEIRPRRGAPELWAQATLLPADKSWCLCCVQAVSPEQAAREEAGPELRERLRAAGYLEGVAAPAVFHLNGLCASWGLGLLHQALLDGLPEGRHQVLSPTRGLLLDVEPPARGCWHCRPHHPGEEADAVAGVPARPLVL